jgi:hypothetical protein
MEAGGENTYLIDPQHGANSGTHIYLTATHQRDTMGLDVQTADYSENAQPCTPFGTASIGNEAASLRLYSKDGGDDLLPGMKIRVWGVYKTQGFGTLKVRNSETGEWESLKTLRGERGKDGADYILTEEDKQEIAEQAAGLVDVPEYTLPIASPDTLGGVQPVEKTEAMTNPVGVDALGGLWCAGGSEKWEQIFSLTAEDNIYSVNIPVVGSDYKYLWLRINVQGWDVAAGAVHSGSDMIGKAVIGASGVKLSPLPYGAGGRYTTIEVLFFNTGRGDGCFLPFVLIPNTNTNALGTVITHNIINGSFVVNNNIGVMAYTSVDRYLFTAGSTFELWGVKK